MNFPFHSHQFVSKTLSVFEGIWDLTFGLKRIPVCKDQVLRFGFQNPGTIIDIRSYYTFGTKIDDNPMLSFDKQSILFVWSALALKHSN